MVLMSKLLLPSIMQNNGEIKGNIVNMGGVVVLEGGAPYLFYVTPKGAIINLTRAIAGYYVPDGI
jgi:NAD(P)-dependent dehydrogenase (short-subunit alcohol dehydrogenase family)